MAKAKQERAEVVYTLTLREDEALFVRDVMRRVGGLPSTTRRGIAEDIDTALDLAGAGYSDFTGGSDGDNMSGTILCYADTELDNG